MAALRPTVAYGNTDDGSGAGVDGSSDDSGQWYQFLENFYCVTAGFAIASLIPVEAKRNDGKAFF